MYRLPRFAGLPRARQALLLECAAALARAAWQVRRWPFARLASSLGQASPPPEEGTAGPAAAAASANDLSPAREVRWAVDAWTRTWPWQITCLMQAVAARRMLDRRGLASDLFLGVRGSEVPSPGGHALPAHAWLRCGPLLVTGAREAARFKAIAVYRGTPAAGSARR